MQKNYLRLHPTLHKIRNYFLRTNGLVSPAWPVLCVAFASSHPRANFTQPCWRKGAHPSSQHPLPTPVTYPSPYSDRVPCGVGRVKVQTLARVGVASGSTLILRGGPEPSGCPDS